jgi:hypothetical protein
MIGLLLAAVLPLVEKDVGFTFNLTAAVVLINLGTLLALRRRRDKSWITLVTPVLCPEKPADLFLLT